MPSRTSAFGATRAPYYGRWPGIFVPRVGGGAQQRVIPNKRVWSTPDQPTLSGMGAAASTPASGIYTEGGYWYRYHAPSGRIVIAISPTSKTEREVPSGSAAYKAIWRQIQNGTAQVTTKSALDAAKLGASAPSTTRRVRVQPEPEIAPMEESLVTRVAQSSWTPWVVGGVIVVGAAFFLLRPRSAPVGG